MDFIEETREIFTLIIYFIEETTEIFTGGFYN